MSIVAAIGSLSLGVIVGWLVRYFIRRFKSFTPKALGTIISIIAGGAVIKFLEAERSVWWFYPIGLLAGFAIYTVLALWALGTPSSNTRYPDSSSKRKSSNGTGKSPYEGVLFEPPKINRKL